jgi:CBS domain containing-hemolysin-like protein
MALIYQIPACLLLIALGGFFAGSETGVYRLSRFRLRLGIERKRPFYALLGKIMDDSPGLVLSMLIGNNLVHYLVTSIVTVMLLAGALSSHAAEIYATVLIAPILFIFSEVIPKNVCYHRADVLMPRFAPLLWFFHKLFTCSGVVALLKTISRIFNALLGPPAASAGAIPITPAGYIRQIIRETRDEGILSSVQNDIMNRLVNVPHVIIASVMTPIAKTEMLDVNTAGPDVLTRLRRCPYTRLPVYEHDRNSIIGFINIYEALRTGRDFENLRDFIKPIERFRTTTSVIDAMNRMRRQNLKIVLVVPDSARRKRPSGVVTMKDLVEELTGELAQW